MSRPVILYGPPAVGKDTITQAITGINPRYALFPVSKVGTGKTGGYRMMPAATLAASNTVISWERYGNVYAVDADALSRALSEYRPVIHLGRPDVVHALLQHARAIHWLVVELSCPRTVARSRLMERNPHEVDDRLRIYDQTPPLANADLRIDTSQLTPTEAAARVLKFGAVE